MNSGKRQRYLSAIKTRAKDLSRLVDSLSEYNRLDSTSFRYHLEPADFPVLLDKTEMKRVLDNLFTNTIRYRGQPQSNVAISLRRVEHSTVVEFIFSDDGPGVPDESLDRIFESFYRVDGARRNSGEGSGIGLAIIIHLPMTEES